MLKKSIFFVIVALIVILGGIYFLRNNEEEKLEIVNETAEEKSEEYFEEEIEDNWMVFENTDYSYTAQYLPEWTVNSGDLERVWFTLPGEDASIVFASATATQTGFPEYEIISSEEFLMDNNTETTIAVLENEGTRAIISAFESNNHPHFVMMSYEYENEQQHEEMIELNKEFLRKITFQ